MRVNKVLNRVLGLGREVVIVGWELTGLDEVAVRPSLAVEVRLRAGRRAVAAAVSSRRRATTRVRAAAAGGMSMSASRPVSSSPRCHGSSVPGTVRR